MKIGEFSIDSHLCHGYTSDNKFSGPIRNDGDDTTMEDGQQGYEKQELLAIAHAMGYHASEELFDEWVEKGLLGKAESRHWLGRGQGSSAKWPALQCELFLVLLRERQGKEVNIPLKLLCNIPVWKWLYWGDLGGVGLPQVKRVMSTWVDYVKKIPAETTRKDAHKVVNTIQGSTPLEKRALLNELTAIGAFEKEVDTDVLRHQLRLVVEGSAKKRRKQDKNRLVLVDDVAYLSSLIPLRFDALAHFEQIEQLPDAVWEWARFFVLFLTSRVQAVHPLVDRDPKLHGRFYRITIKTLCEPTCYTLLTPLAMAAHHLFDEKNPQILPVFTPSVWQQGKIIAHMRTNLVSSGILLPDGNLARALHHEIAIDHQETHRQFTVHIPFN